MVRLSLRKYGNNFSASVATIFATAVGGFSRMFYFRGLFSYNRYDRWIVLGYVPEGHDMETRFRVRWTLKCK